MSSIPLIGAPKLSDAPLLPNDVLDAYLGPLLQGVAAGAPFSQPVQVELLVLATALRDLKNLRARARIMLDAAGTLNAPNPQVEAEICSVFGGLEALLPAVSDPKVHPNSSRLQTGGGPHG